MLSKKTFIIFIITSIVALESISHSYAAICKAVDGTEFLTSSSVANKFSLALEACQVVKKQAINGTLHTHLYEAQQLRLYGSSLFQESNSPEFIDVEKISGGLSAEQVEAALKVFYGPQGGPVKLAVKMYSVAMDYNIDPLLLHAIAHVESRHNSNAISHAGALGVMQVTPATAKRFGVLRPELELYDPLINITAGSAYLKWLQRLFGNNLPLVLAAYNAGENAVIKYGYEIPPYSETQTYVKNVMDHYRMLRASP